MHFVWHLSDEPPAADVARDSVGRGGRPPLPSSSFATSATVATAAGVDLDRGSGGLRGLGGLGSLGGGSLRLAAAAVSAAHPTQPYGTNLETFSGHIYLIITYTISTATH